MSWICLQVSCDISHHNASVTDVKAASTVTHSSLICCTNFKPLFHKMNPQKLLPGVVMLGHGSGDNEVEDGRSIHHPTSFCLR